MSIEAINKQLLRAIGVGVALADLGKLRLRFRNDSFVEWFGEGEGEVRLGEVFPTIDIEALQSALRAEGRFATEMAVLVCQNITRIKEL